MKIARTATGRPAVIVFENAFHGRTLLTMTMTAKLVYKKGFGPFAPEVYRAPGPYPYRGVSSDAALEALQDLFRSDVDPQSVACAVLEPVQGEGGFIPMPEDFPGRLQELLSTHGILYVDDEVQSGIGRTGPVWAIEHYGVKPDIVVSGKSLGGGLPLAGVTGRAGVMDAAHPGGLGGTFGGNPAVLRGGARRPRRGGDAGIPGAGGRDRRANSREARWMQPRVPADRRGARPRPDARTRARRRPRVPEARRRPREACDRAGEGARPHPPRLRHVRQRPAAAAAARSTPTRSSRRASTSWRECLSTQARERPSTTEPEIVEADVRLVEVRKTFGDVVAVDSIDLEIQRGEFFTMLGPSGSGKTTTLRMIAGFEQPDSGQILLGGVDVARQAAVRPRREHRLPGLRALPAHDGRGERRVRAQGQARAQGGAPDARARRRSRPSASPQFGARKPAQLSGGQRQRVALARALVNRPRVLLLDEPLGALDLKLREEMQIELKRIQQEVGITFIYVTHDQDEALTMSDRIAVFSHGRIDQVGTPVEVYEHPATEFVAGFVGVSNMLERNGPTLHRAT